MELQDRKKCPQLGCKKEIYKDAEQALDEIQRIISTQRKINDVKPTRAYRCDCGWYCLTSSINIVEYKNGK
jgi:hypothetical protein